ncbi:MAG: transposase [Proteobacteria bacterium]|nr:transposase [Pseudomonadota bacterium]
MTGHLWQGTWNGRSPAGDIHVRSRTIVRHTGGIVRGKFPSRKNGRMVHHEGLLELDAIYLFETSPRVVRYREQPERVQYADGEKLRRYTPDFEVGLNTGEVFLVEVKPRRSLVEPTVAHTLAKVREHLGRRQQRFLVLTDEHLRIEPLQSNLRWICHQAPRLHPSATAIHAAVARLQAVFPISLREASIALAPMGADPFSALMAGVLTCDLSVPVSLETLVQPVEESGHEWFRITRESDL